MAEPTPDDPPRTPNIVAKTGWGGFIIVALVAVAARQWWLLIVAVLILIAHFIIRRLWPL